jgi:hypothetical protein
MTGGAVTMRFCGATATVPLRILEIPATTATNINANFIQTINGATAIAVTMIRTVPCEVGTFVNPGGAANFTRLTNGAAESDATSAVQPYLKPLRSLLTVPWPSE